MTTEKISNGKKLHLKIPIELYAIQMLTKLLYCSVTSLKKFQMEKNYI